MGNVLFGQLQLAATFAYELINPVSLMPAHVEAVIAIVMILLVVMWVFAKYSLVSTTVMCGLVFVCILGCFYIHVQNNSRHSKLGIDLKHPTSMLKKVSPKAIVTGAKKKMSTAHKVVNKQLKATGKVLKDKVKIAKAKLKSHKKVGNILKNKLAAVTTPASKKQVTRHAKKKTVLKKKVEVAKKNHVDNKQAQKEHKATAKAAYKDKKKRDKGAS